MKIQELLLVVLICSPTLEASAESFFNQTYEGWHWYEAKKKAKAIENDSNDNKSNSSSLTPSEQIKETRDMQEKLLHKALVDPSEENIIKYLQIQKTILDGSYKFTQGYRKVMQTHPEFNETINKYPVSQVGSQIYQKQKKSANTDILNKAAKTHGLFFFYKTGCQYCEQFIPVIKMFADKYHFEIIPISIDGKKHEAFPNTRTNLTLGKKLDVKAVPAIYLVEPKTNNITPVSFGYTALDGLEEKVSYIYQNMQHVQARENESRGADVRY